MMLDNFLQRFSITSKNNEEQKIGMNLKTSSQLFEFFESFSGCTFNNGLYRIHTITSSIHWSLLIGEYFKFYLNSILPFAFDWMGRQFCTDHTGEYIFMFDPATMEDFKLIKKIDSFHNEELTSDMLALKVFKNVLKKNNIKTLNDDECFGYKVPLFLSGKDDLDNYEKLNMEVYWHISYQLFIKTSNLPEGTKIGNVKLE